MLEASFEKGAGRSAAVSGAYQYDTGQRLRMHGLPSPQELAQADDLLSGDMVTMQVHFGLKGDAQTQARLAQWDGSCWLVMIPDEYMLAAESVYAYVYVSHGADENGNGRTKTMYELTFRPIARPAPNNVVTGEQWEAWAAKKAEITLSVSALESARAQAQAVVHDTQEAALQAGEAANQADEAAEAAQQGAQRLEETERSWQQMTLRVISLQAGEQATAALQGSMLTLGIVRGAPGAKGETGDTGPADIALSVSDGVLTITPSE